jgi:hypothetical protein
VKGLSFNFEEPSMSLKKYEASCNCGRVRFEAMIDLGQGTGRCNCTACRKLRFWGAQIKPEAFTLVSGKEDLFREHHDMGSFGYANRYFCKHCGVHPYGDGEMPSIMGKYVSVNVGAIDDISEEERSALPIRYMDGLHDNWFNPPKITSYL